MLIPEETFQLIRQRRSVFPAQYTGERIEDSLVWQILESANWAPTHGKTEPWRFVVFTKDALPKLADAQAEAYQKSTALDSFDEAKYNKLLTNPRKASHVIAIVMKRQATAKIPEIEEIAAVACAVQNMHLMAVSLGVGAFWSTGGLTYLAEGKQFLGLGEDDKLMGFFYLGVIAKPSADSARKPITEKVIWKDK
ncbi:MAG: nitroreductase [Cytophagales bacterium]|nr:MAG: nitroreductase [Cytophagales bacterium]